MIPRLRLGSSGAVFISWNVPREDPCGGTFRIPGAPLPVGERGKIKRRRKRERNLSLFFSVGRARKHRGLLGAINRPLGPVIKRPLQLPTDATFSFECFPHLFSFFFFFLAPYYFRFDPLPLAAERPCRCGTRHGRSDAIEAL